MVSLLPRSSSRLHRARGIGTFELWLDLPHQLQVLESKAARGSRPDIMGEHSRSLIGIGQPSGPRRQLVELPARSSALDSQRCIDYARAAGHREQPVVGRHMQ